MKTDGESKYRKKVTKVDSAMEMRIDELNSNSDLVCCIHFLSNTAGKVINLFLLPSPPIPAYRLNCTRNWTLTLLCSQSRKRTILKLEAREINGKLFHYISRQVLAIQRLKKKSEERRD